MSLTIIIVAAVVALCILYSCFKGRKGLPLPPGPSLLESFKIVMSFIKNDDIHIRGEELAKQYGELCNVKFFGQNMIFVSSARLTRKLLATSGFRDVTNDRPSSYLRDHIHSGGQSLAFNDYNDHLIKMRKLVHGVVRLYGDGLQDFEEMVGPELDVLMEKLTKAAEAGEKVYNMDKALTQSIIRILHVFLTNERVKADDTESICAIIENFNRDFNKALTVDINLILSMFPWLQYLPGPPGRMARSLKKTQKTLLDYLLDPKKKSSFKGNGSMIGTLIEAQETDPLLTDVLIKGVLSDLVAGGFITTKGALSGIFLTMIHYPEVQHRLQVELDEKLGTKKPSLGDRPELHYTNAVILECLRYIRHVPLGVPHLVKQDIDIEGYRIPAKSTLVTNIYFTSRADDLWDKPEVFNPNRYLDDEGKLLPSDHPIRQQFMPFGVGRRVCVGESFAKSRIFLYVTNLLQKFEFRRGDNKLVSEDSSTWTPSGAFCPQFLNCEIVKRK